MCQHTSSASKIRIAKSSMATRIAVFSPVYFYTVCIIRSTRAHVARHVTNFFFLNPYGRDRCTTYIVQLIVHYSSVFRMKVLTMSKVHFYSFRRGGFIWWMRRKIRSNKEFGNIVKRNLYLSELSFCSLGLDGICLKVFKSDRHRVVYQMHQGIVYIDGLNKLIRAISVIYWGFS